MFIDRSITADEDRDEEIQQFDLLAGGRRVEAAVGKLAAIRKRMWPEELGELAGIGVLDQYSVASAEISIRWWKTPVLALAGLYVLIDLGLPLLGFLAGIAIDVAVFGGAAASLIQASPIYAAFAVGSLVFAAGVGMAPKGLRAALIVLMLLACLGASVIAADNPRFRSHFANLFPAMKTEEQARERDLARIRGEIAGWRSAIAEKRDQLQPRDRPAMLTDGTRDNDEEAHLLTREIGALTGRLARANEEAGEMQARLAQAGRENQAQHLGRIFGGLYIFSWLAASQLVIAIVLMSARGRVARQRRRAREFALKRRFVRHLDGPNRDKSEAVVAAAVGDLLMRFNVSMTENAAGDPEKLAAFTDLFQSGPIAQMRGIAVDLVCKTLRPRRARGLRSPRGGT